MIEIIYNRKLTCGESPIWDYRNGKCFWVDALDACIYSFDVVSQRVECHKIKSKIGSIVMHENGSYILGGHDGLFVWDGESEPQLIMKECDGIILNNINEMIVDCYGRILIGQEVYNEDNVYEKGFLFKVDLDLKISVLEKEMSISNGMAFDTKNNKFYLIDSVDRIVYRYDYFPDEGLISNKSRFIEFNQNDGLPDGMTIDREGNLWIALWFGGKICKFNNEGKLLDELKLPALQLSSLCFGGQNLNELYITSADILWETKLAPIDFNYNNRGGETFKISTDIYGIKENLSKLRI